MRKLSILSLLVLTSLFSQAQTLSGVLYDSSLGLDFWKLDEKLVFIHIQRMFN